MTRALLAIAGLVVSAPAIAAPVLESESNNTLATANVLTPAEQAAFMGSNAFVFDGVLTGAAGTAPADVDWLAIDLPVGGYLTAAMYGIPNSMTGNTIMGLFDSAGAWIAANDDDNLGDWPSLEAVLPAGRYYIALGLFGDAVTSGPSTPSDWDGFGRNQTPIVSDPLQYKLVVGYNAIPTPSAAVLLGLGGMAVARRRR